jgi:hypothetical protein
MVMGFGERSDGAARGGEGRRFKRRAGLGSRQGDGRRSTPSGVSSACLSCKRRAALVERFGKPSWRAPANQRRHTRGRPFCGGHCAPFLAHFPCVAPGTIIWPRLGSWADGFVEPPGLARAATAPTKKHGFKRQYFSIDRYTQTPPVLMP